MRVQAWLSFLENGHLVDVERAPLLHLGATAAVSARIFVRSVLQADRRGDRGGGEFTSMPCDRHSFTSPPDKSSTDPCSTAAVSHPISREFFTFPRHCGRSRIPHSPPWIVTRSRTKPDWVFWYCCASSGFSITSFGSGGASSPGRSRVGASQLGLGSGSVFGFGIVRVLGLVLRLVS